MTVLRINHRDEAVLPYFSWREIQLGELAGNREYVLPHPYLPCELRARPVGSSGRRGTAREWCYPADYQLRLRGRDWPSRWVESADLIGTIHDLSFDATDPVQAVRWEALANVQRKVERALARFGIESGWPHGWEAADAKLKALVRGEG